MTRLVLRLRPVSDRPAHRPNPLTYFLHPKFYTLETALGMVSSAVANRQDFIALLESGDVHFVHLKSYSTISVVEEGGLE